MDETVVNKLQKTIADLNEAAFLVSVVGNERVVHSIIMDSIYVLRSVKDEISANGLETEIIDRPKLIHSDSESENNEIQLEIEKVKRKLKLWKGREHQVNHRILSVYRDFLLDGHEVITEEMIRHQFGDDSTFFSNFPQLCNIAPKNHAKIFSKLNGNVIIWPKVEKYVLAYFEINKCRNDC